LGAPAINKVLTMRQPSRLRAYAMPVTLLVADEALPRSMRPKSGRLHAFRAGEWWRSPPIVGVGLNNSGWTYRDRYRSAMSASTRSAPYTVAILSLKGIKLLDRVAARRPDRRGAIGLLLSLPGPCASAVRIWRWSPSHSLSSCSI